MANVELDDSPESLQARETQHAVPVGIWVLFGALIAWGVWYFFRYIGWNQAAEVESGARTALRTNIGSTIGFTALATIAAIALAVGMARRRRAKR